MATVSRGEYKFVESGLKNVVLQGLNLIRCGKCGTVDPILPRINELMRVIALAIVAKPYRMRGDELRFLRKYLNKTQEEFVRLVKVDKTTLSKWENDEDPIGAQSDLLIRAITLGLGEGLRTESERIMEGFPDIQKSRRRLRIEVSPGKKKPSSSAVTSYEYKYA